MKKSLIALMSVIIMSASFQANAMVGAVALLLNPTVGIKIALSGLGMIELGRVINRTGDNEWDGFGLWVAGTIMLDGEQGSSVVFKEITAQEAKVIGLTEQQQTAYNNNNEELTYLFSLVANEAVTTEDSKQLWAENEELIGSDSINAMKKVLKYTLE